MKFSIGDKIVLIRTGEEGHVTAYIDKQMIEVEVGDTVFPVYIEDVEHPYLKWFTGKAGKKKTQAPEQLPVEKIKERKPRLAKGIYLSFLPVFKTDGIDDIVDSLKVYLLNEMPQAVKFGYDVRIDQKSSFRHEGVLHGFGNVYLHSISYTDMNDQPRFHWSLTDTTNEQMEKAEDVLRIRPAKLFEHISQLMKNNESTFSYLLLEDFAAKKKATPIEKFEPVAKPPFATVTTKTIDPPKYEVDLHIEALVGNHRGLSNSEIMRIQLDALQRYLHLAIVHRQSSMIVIHGLGKGKLRDEVHSILRQTPEVGRFKNEWSGRYGFGATEIFFRY